MADWQAAAERMQQGMRDPEGQTLSQTHPGRAGDYGYDTPETFWSRKPERSIEAVPFGDMADPVSQLAFMLAPQLLPALKGLRAPGGMPSARLLGNQRGAVGGGGGEVPRWKPGDMSRAQWEREITEQHLDAMEMGTGRAGQHEWTPGGLVEGKRSYAADAPRRLEIQEQVEAMRPVDEFTPRQKGSAPGTPAFLDDLYHRLLMKKGRTSQEEAMFHRLKTWREGREQARRLKYGY